MVEVPLTLPVVKHRRKMNNTITLVIEKEGTCYKKVCLYVILIIVMCKNKQGTKSIYRELVVQQAKKKIVQVGGDHIQLHDDNERVPEMRICFLLILVICYTTYLID